MTAARRGADATLTVALLAIAGLCLPPGAGPRAPRFDPCVLCGTDGVATGLLNVLLFVPLGLAVTWRTGRARTAVVAGAGVSLAIELLQLVIPGRDPALGDLLANSFGAALGGGLATHGGRWLMPTGRDRGPAGGVALVIVLALLAAPRLLFAPSAPVGDYYAQWGRAERWTGYAGTVVDARLADRPLPSRRLDDPDGVRAALIAGAPLSVRFVPGPRTRGLAPVLRLVAGPYDAGVEAVQLGVDGEALVLTPRLRADDARLARPEVQVPRALRPHRPADTLTLTLARDAGPGFLVIVAPRDTTRVAFTVGRGWSLLHQVGVRRDDTLLLLDLAWCATLGLLLGWSGVAAARAAGLAAIAAASAMALPLGSVLAATPLGEPLALLAGSAAGCVAVRAARRLRQRFVGAQSS